MFFTLVLPPSTQGQTRPPRTALPRVESLAEGHSVYALIVDDMTTNRDLMKRIVKEHGATATKIVAVSASVFEHQQRQYEEAGFDGFIDKPVRAEAVYGALAETLGVAFRYAAPPGPPTESPPAESPDWSDIRLPVELARELESAARRQSITDLNRHFTTLEELGDAEKHLADHLREMSRKFDMNGLRTAIDGVTAQ